MSATSPARVDDPAAARRQVILDAARAAIEEHGPQALTGQIADRAGLARPNVYRHFASKEALDLALARSAYHELRAAIRAQFEVGRTPLDVIRAPIAAQVVWADEHPNLYRFLVSRGHQQSAQRPRASRSAFAAELVAAGARYIPQFGEDADAAEVTMAGILGLVDASVLWWLDRRTGTREQLVETLTAQAWLIIDHRLRMSGVILDPSAPLSPPPRTTDR
ncbi:TetR/AcrR family transcriptional regulator [Rhodococcus ruber]|uniref:Putative transcriptional regulator n=1 Tax=Rhodococcus ruber TaxID=1830 RepID=A0A098BG03_9NOCA|nr:TetR/AcrR family transcriptional regulator [Rhodococcus ruber]MCD2129562.1 TetR/AcrR family transcriptional regulator [Rhodococcus ruber]MCZ4506054.1 TetR/AcrR family transcriptional regulator [Rhodococcus ruber]MCZ4533155.1 TetR/AcrR family transcriptional regulator [Rhodococcus ruber]MCZ4623574.1 TetR/AcrR family transcriptional regulator [Rhodococcus ruber]MDI9970657.1 TetR/AcrR family transcriptional regulator [Rhodococcus ruber]